MVHRTIDLYNEILRLSPDNATAHYWLGNKHYEINDFPTSLDHYDRAIKILSGSEIEDEIIIDVMINRSGNLCELKKYKEAIEDCDKILKRFREHPDFADIEKSCSWIKNNCRKQMTDN